MNKPLLPSKKWTSHLQDEKLIKEFSQRLLESKDLFQRLTGLIETLQSENAKSRVDKASYEKPAWSEYQADTNGYERACLHILEYLKFTKE